MSRHIKKIVAFISVISLFSLSGVPVLALPSQATAHAQANNSTNASAGKNVTTGTNNNGVSNQNSNKPTTTGQANGQAHMQAGQLKACQNRQAAITNIINRIDTRAQNQLTLFSTIASRVENFYTTKGKTVANYDQLVADITSAETTAQTNLTTMKANSTFSCSLANPKGMVSAFQSYLKTEISDLRNYRTAVKNLIVAVATANNVTVSTSNTSTTTGGK